MNKSMRSVNGSPRFTSDQVANDDDHLARANCDANRYGHGKTRLGLIRPIRVTQNHVWKYSMHVLNENAVK